MTELDKEGIDHEITFWKRFVKDPRFVDSWIPDNVKTVDLQDEVYEFLKSRFPKNGKCLDVGSGVVSILRGTLPSDSIVTIDPLTALYQQAFDYDKHGIKPPADYACEDLPEMLYGQFDVVHISNALDHVRNPFEAFKKLHACTRPGGYLIVQGLCNEARHENWQGFHQFNITTVAPHFLFIEGKAGYMKIIDNMYGEVMVCLNKQLETGREWFIWVCKVD
jgi:2-polyprenyl-3-methyl-5-hydroxy-6-metoxy-1,4-benzoquinol methylase